MNESGDMATTRPPSYLRNTAQSNNKVQNKAINKKLQAIGCARARGAVQGAQVGADEAHIMVLWQPGDDHNIALALEGAPNGGQVVGKVAVGDNDSLWGCRGARGVPDGDDVDDGGGGDGWLEGAE